MLRISFHNSHSTMAPSTRLCLGEGACCSCLVIFIRSSKDGAAALVNPKPGRRIDDLIAVSRDVMTRGGKTFVSIFFRSSTIPGLLHAAERWIKVDEALALGGCGLSQSTHRHCLYQ